MAKIWCALLIGVISALAQSPKSDIVSMMTGRAWETMSETTKLFYLQGVKDGLMIAEYSQPADIRESVVKQVQANGFNPGDYLKELDKLFAERENLNIPLPLAYQYITTKLRGSSTRQELEQMLIELRKAMAK